MNHDADSVSNAKRFGELGPVHLARGAFLQDWLLLGSDNNWRLDTSRGSLSRTAADIGVHWLDLVAPIAVGGLWLAAFLWQLQRRSLLPWYEPRLQEAMHHG